MLRLMEGVWLAHGSDFLMPKPVLLHFLSTSAGVDCWWLSWP